MGALYRYAIEAIERKHVTAYSEILAVKFVVSTPARWPDTVKSTILKVIFNSEKPRIRSDDFRQPGRRGSVP
jgi:hypothetical protein